jgi:hypothetical protein
VLTLDILRGGVGSGGKKKMLVFLGAARSSSLEDKWESREDVLTLGLDPGGDRRIAGKHIG